MAEETETTRYKWVCPACGREMLGPNIFCGGDFLDKDHPSAVQPKRELATQPFASPSHPREER